MKGKRCNLNDEGCRTFPQKIARGAVIVGESLDKHCWRVRWDGNTSSEAIHKDYIQVLD